MKARTGSNLKAGYATQVEEMTKMKSDAAGGGPGATSMPPSEPPLPSDISELAREPDTVPTPAPTPLPAAKPTLDGVLKVMRKNNEILKSTSGTTPQAQASSPSVMEDATRPRSTAPAARARPKRAGQKPTLHGAGPTSSSNRGDKSTVPTPDRVLSPVQEPLPSSSPTQSGNSPGGGGSPTASTDRIAALHRQYTRYQSATVSQRRTSEPWLAESAAAATLIGALSAANEALKRENEAIKAENALLKGIAVRLDADNMEIGQGDGEKENVVVEPQQEEEAELGQEEREPGEPLREEPVEEIRHEEELQPREQEKTELKGVEAQEPVEPVEPPQVEEMGPPQEEEMELPQEEEMELGRGEEEPSSMVEEPDLHDEPPKVQQEEEEEEEEAKSEHKPEEKEEEEELIMIEEHFQHEEPVEPPREEPVELRREEQVELRREEQVEPQRKEQVEPQHEQQAAPRLEEEHDVDPATIEEVIKNVPAPAQVCSNSRLYNSTY
ncbi:hypothetical protein C8R47DRAFT_46021 [Mycena vitilis]|nr:hypothetical protein C8R47DRAFT_46021 [Mycena vitilis]